MQSISREEIMSLLINHRHYQIRTALNETVNQKFLDCIQYFVEHQTQLNNLFDPSYLTNSPKISKGENYLGYPWMILDYPRNFTKESIFAVRILCWYGNYISITLHLSGLSFDRYGVTVMNALEKSNDNNLYYCINEDEWKHHLTEENYLTLIRCKELKIDIKNDALKKGFLKLAKKISFSEFDQLPKIALQTLLEFAALTK
jgi:hypothetical protein